MKEDNSKESPQNASVPEEDILEGSPQKPDVTEDSMWESDGEEEILIENSISEEVVPGELIPQEEHFEMPEQIMREETVWEDPLPEETVPISGSTVSFSHLKRIGINVQLGLDYCCGEEEFYLEMLRMFCEQAVDKRAEIVFLYESANWTDYTVKVHALKSTSLTIGAERLAEQAKMLEQAGKKGNIEYVRHGHPILLRMYDEVCETITGL